jgi:hypothetical protein
MKRLLEVTCLVAFFTSVAAGRAEVCTPSFHLETVEGLRQTADCFDALLGVAEYRRSVRGANCWSA